MSEERAPAESLSEALDDLFVLRERLDKVLDEIEDRLVEELPAEPATCPVLDLGRALRAACNRSWRFIFGAVTGWRGNIPA